jgi:hypothetical protein
MKTKAKSLLPALTALSLSSIGFLLILSRHSYDTVLKSKSIPISAVEEQLVGDIFNDFHQKIKHLEFESLRNSEQDSRHPLPSMVIADT